MLIDKIAVAIDLSSKDQIISLLSQLDPKPKIIKIGLQVTSYLGVNNTIDLIKSQSPESQIFLDLKLHDIPNTVAQAVKNFSKMGVDYLTIHSLGGESMMSAAQEVSGDLNLIAVTVLTSHSINEWNLIANTKDIQSSSLTLAKSAYKSGIRWIVSSADECPHIKKEIPGMNVVTPGIRPVGSNKDDQARIHTPHSAIVAGSDMLVIGRPIYKAESPQQVWKEIID